MARAAQLNVRMNPQVKRAGDSVLDLYGISSTELIRALWEKISLGEVALAQVLCALATDPSAGSSITQTKARSSNSMASLVLRRQMDFEQEVRMDPSTYVPLSDDELEDLVYEDWLEERRATDDN